MLKRLGGVSLHHRRHKETQSACRDDYKTELTAISGGLESFTCEVDRRFLAVGEVLASSAVSAREMSAGAGDVCAQVTGEALTAGIDALGRMLDELRTYLDETEGSALHQGEVLGGYLVTLQKVAATLEGMRDLVLNLNMLGFFTRVENAHVEGDDTRFDTLASDVQKLAAHISEKRADILVRCRELENLIDGSLRQVERLESARRRRSADMLENTVRAHQTLQQRHAVAVRAAKDITRASEEVAGEISQAVTAVQYNDIVRQQIIHAREAFDNFMALLDDGTLTDEARVHRALADLGGLQEQQLSLAGRSLNEAGAGIVDNLAGVAGRVTRMQEQAHGIFWTGDGGGRFMDTLESGLGEIIAAIAAQGTEQRELAENIGRVTAQVGEMAVFVGNIERFGLELQLIALNARIKAAHIGSQGATLDTISGSIYEMSRRSRADTRELSALLRTMVVSAGRVDAEFSGQIHDLEARAGAFRDELAAVLDKLHGANRQVEGLWGELLVRGETLVCDLDQGSARFAAHDSEQTIIDDVSGRLSALVKLAASRAEVHPASAPLLDELVSRYTMESERTVHEEYLGVGVEASPEAHGPPVGEDDDLGDNVELF